MGIRNVRRYTESERLNALKLAEEIGQSAAAEQLKIPIGTVSSWSHAARQRSATATAAVTTSPTATAAPPAPPASPGPKETPPNKVQQPATALPVSKSSTVAPTTGNWPIATASRGTSGITSGPATGGGASPRTRRWLTRSLAATTRPSRPPCKACSTRARRPAGKAGEGGRSRQWAVGSGQWAVGSGQWSVTRRRRARRRRAIVSGPWSAVSWGDVMTVHRRFAFC